jgi:hypothetical protein
MRMSKHGAFPADAGLSSRVVIKNCDRTPPNWAVAVPQIKAEVHKSTLSFVAVLFIE